MKLGDMKGNDGRESIAGTDRNRSVVRERETTVLGPAVGQVNC